MQKGIILSERFELIGGRWHKTSEWTDADAIIDRQHWEKWQRFFSNGEVKPATLRTQCGYMVNFVSYSPDGKHKTRAKLLRYISGGEYLSYFDKLENLSNREYLKLYEKAQKAAALKGIDLKKEGAFISSSGVAHGFYLPNNEDCLGVFFCCGHAVLVPSRLVK